MFDINLNSLVLEKGLELDKLPGLIALTPPRRAARGREYDLVIAMVNFNASSSLASENNNQWFQEKVERYYQTPGTVTFAMKALVEALNNDLLERNLKKVKESGPISAALSLLVLRRRSLYMVNIGSARAWYSSANETSELSECESQTRGLGVDQMLPIRFATREVNENDVLVFSCQPAEVWKVDTFAGCAGLSDEAVSRRIFSQVGSELKAVMLRFTVGKGLIKSSTMNGKQTSARQSGNMTSTPIRPKDVNLEIHQDNAGVSGQDVIVHPSVNNNNPLKHMGEVPSTPVLPIGINQAVNESAAEPRPIDSQETRRERLEKQNKPQITETQVMAGKLTKKVVSGVGEASSIFSRFLQKLLPGLTDEPLKLNRGSLIAIAVTIPLVIALIAGAVYVRSGKSKQFNQNLILAQQYAMQAEVQKADPPLYLASLQQSMYWLDKAESYGQSESSASLRVKVQNELDILQGVQRLEMAEVVPGGLPAGASISQIVATANDVYLLDKTSGTVSRYFLGGSSYEKDEAFDCGPNEDNPLNLLDKIVDILPLNVNNTFKATLLAIDAKGSIQFCIPGDAGVTGALTQPDQGWKNIQAATISDNYLYVLDGAGNAVYRFEGNGIQFENKPTLFFDNQIPSLTEAIDIEVNVEELYILRSNGQMVECMYSYMKDYKLTECKDPAPYGDMRTGQVPQAINFPEANFIQMRMTAAPDSSIYLLDTTAKALFHFSLQRNLQKVLHPRLMNGLNIDRLTPTAFAVSSGRIAFMAFGNQIFYAPLP